jgi:hypothetical protein
MRDLLNHVQLVSAIPPAAATADNTPWVSAIIDTKGFGSAMFALNFGALADADATFAVVMHDGDDAALADAAVVDPTQLLGTTALAAATFDDDNEPRKLGYIGDKRYIRLTVTPAANTGNAFLSAVAILGHAAMQPTANPPI